MACSVFTALEGKRFGPGVTHKMSPLRSEVMERANLSVNLMLGGKFLNTLKKPTDTNFFPCRCVAPPADANQSQDSLF